MDYTALGHRIRTLRTASGLTQAELAERVGISASFLGHIERGTRVLSVDTLAALCAARPGCTMEDCIEFARMYSSEIEYDEDNVAALLDALWEE